MPTENCGLVGLVAHLYIYICSAPPPGPTFLNTCSYATIHFQNKTTCLDQQINSITSSAKTIKHIRNSQFNSATSEAISAASQKDSENALRQGSGSAGPAKGTGGSRDVRLGRRGSPTRAGTHS